MNKILLFLLATAMPIAATPQTSDADLKNVQMNIKVNGDGSLAGYGGAVTLNGTSAVTPQNAYMINSASIIHGNVTEVLGASFGPNPAFDTTSSGTLVDCVGDTGLTQQIGGAGGTGAGAVLIEGPKLHSSGVVQAGDCGAANPDYGYTEPGGDASVTLDPTKTSWPNFTMTCGMNGGYASSNASLTLNSSQGSATLHIHISGLAYPNYYGGGNVYIRISGASLTTINLTMSVDSAVEQITSADFSGSVANQASVDGIAAQFAAITPTMASISGTAYGTLNCAGGCATPSSAGSDNFTIIASYGMTVYTN